jgi:hypothetical protein
MLLNIWGIGYAEVRVKSSVVPRRLVRKKMVADIFDLCKVL